MKPDERPYWWRAAPRPDGSQETLPGTCDFAVVGSGITGLSAAYRVARAGRSVVVLDQGAIGEGASSRNAGYVGRTAKHGLGELIEKRGLDFALRFYGELRQAYDCVLETVAEEKIACHLERQGRLTLAATPQQYEALGRELDLKKKHLGDQGQMISKSDQGREIATDRYFGGAFVPDMSGLHPGLYHQGLVDAAKRQGVALHAHTPVTALTPNDDGVAVTTSQGVLQARDVLVATNGYSGSLWPWWQKRLVPFDAYMVATQDLGENRVKSLLPGGRTYIDWNFNVDFIRHAPGAPGRILFGGLTGPRPKNLQVTAERLRARLAAMLPDLADVRLGHVWTGRCAGTRDLNPRLGFAHGLHYAGGYCFAGVPAGTWFGKLVANRLLGQGSQESVFSEHPRAFPLHRMASALVPVTISWLSRKDG